MTPTEQETVNAVIADLRAENARLRQILCDVFTEAERSANRVSALFGKALEG